MSSKPPGDGDELFCKLLATYDEKLAADGALPIGPPFGGLPDLRLRLERAQDILCLLEIDRLLAKPNQGDVTTSAVIPSARLGRFKLLSVLGVGGFGVVYLAEDPLLGRQVAVKVPRPEALVTRELRQRFLREAQASGRLSHPHIVPVYDSGESGPFTYLVSAYYAGGTLADWIHQRTTAVPVGTAARVVASLADAVQHAHERGVLHRDLKPANVILEPLDADAAGLGFLPRVTDFGLAKLVEPGGLEDRPSDSTAVLEDLGHTRTQTLLGTTQYMAPEQAEGRASAVGPWTDVYALGAILYELLTGKPVVANGTRLEMLRHTVELEPVAPRRVRPDVPRDLEAICLKCLEKVPARRYPRAADVADDLRRFAAGRPTQARPVSPCDRLVKWLRRRPLAASLLAVMSFSLSAFALAGAWHLRQVRDYHLAVTAAADREHAAAQRERSTREDAYAADMALIARQWERLPTDRLRKMLNQHRPGPDQKDSRGFEWWYLWEQANRLRTLEGHRSRVHTVTFSSDTSRCLSIGWDDSFREWRTNTGQLCTDPLGLIASKNTAAISPGGKYRVIYGRSASGYESLALCDLDTRRTWQKSIQTVDNISVVVSPGGQVAYMAGMRPAPLEVHLWDLTSAEDRVVWRKPGRVAYAMWLSPDGCTLAVAHVSASNGPINVIDLLEVATGREKAQLVGHEQQVFAAAFTPDSRTLATGDRGGQVILWDATDARELRRLPHFADRVGSVAFSPDASVLAVGTDPPADQTARGSVVLWNVADGIQRGEQLHPGCGITSLAFAPDGQTIAVAGWDYLVRLWSPCASLLGHAPKEAWDVAFTPDGRTLVSAGDDHTVRLWDVGTRTRRAVLEGHESLANCVAVSPDGALVASGSFDKTVRIWEVATGRLVATCRGHTHHVRHVTFSPDGKTLASSGRDGTVRLWEVPGGRLAATLQGHTAATDGLVFDPTGRQLASASNDETVRLWDVESRQNVGILANNSAARAVLFTADGRSLISSDANGLIKAWHVQTGKVRVLLGNGRSGRLARSPDGRTMAAACDDNVVRLWHLPTGTEILALPTGYFVHGVAFSPDGQTLAAALHDGTIRLWHAPRRE